MYLLEGENNYPSKVEITPPSIYTNSIERRNSSNTFEKRIVGSDFFTSQDRELISILHELQNSNVSGTRNNTESNCLTGYFCSDTVFNLSHRVWIEVEIGVLEKGLYYALTQNKINEPELIDDFNKFCRRMPLK